MKLELIAFTQRGNALSEQLAKTLSDHGHQAACTRDGLKAEEWAERAFSRSEGLIFVGATGIAVRSIAPHLRHKSTDPAVVVVDEAYIEFRDPGTPTALELIGEYENLAVSRTMSKAFAFAGARVGYLAANKGIIDCVRIVRMPYHLSAVTQAAALAAFEHTDEQLSRVAHLRETRNATSAWLKEQTYKGQPLEVAETQSNFILFGGHFDDRDRIFDELLKRGVLIRVVGPEGWMRVCMGTDEEMARFREALVEVLRIVEQG